MVDREHIVSEIRRTAQGNGGSPLGRARFFAATGIREGDWLGRYWAKWGDALQEAGFEPNKLQGRFEEEEMLRLLALETRRLGHLPTVAELRLRRREDLSFPSSGAFDRLGGKQARSAKLAAFCRERPEFADVAQLLIPLLEASSKSLPKEQSRDDIEVHGFVYLLKSGQHYKLGRTNSVGRREYELAIQLPEKAVKVHEIKTDDPAGIENYWHRRFAERRANGEWFDLTSSDVKAFKRRKFM